MHRDIITKEKLIHPHKAIVKPEFNAPTVLVDDQLNYVEMWLKRKAKHALVYWHPRINSAFDVKRGSNGTAENLTARKMILNSRNIIH